MYTESYLLQMNLLESVLNKNILLVDYHNINVILFLSQ